MILQNFLGILQKFFFSDWPGNLGETWQQWYGEGNRYDSAVTQKSNFAIRSMS